MKKVTLFLGILSILAIGTPLFAVVTDIRGEIVRFDEYYKKYEPLANIKVELLQNSKTISSTYTNSKGVYYLYRIVPGSYTLHFKGKTFNINVQTIDKSRQDFQKIEKFILR